METDATIKDSCKESPGVTDVSSSQRIAEVSFTKQKGDNVGELVDMGPDFSLEASSIKTDATIKCKDSPSMTDLSSSQRSAEVSLTKRKGDAIFELRDMDPDFSLEGSFMETDAARKNSCKDSPTMTDLSSSQRSAEVNLTMNKRRKNWSPIHNAVVSNVDGIVETRTTETSVPALHIVPLHPVQYLPINPVIRNLHAGSNFCSEENEGKEHNMLEKAAENSNGEGDLQEESSRSSLALVNGEHFIKESLSEVRNLNIVQATIYNCSNPPEDNNGYVKNASLIKKHDNYGINSGYSSCVNYNKEPVMGVDNEDDSNKISAEPLAVDLVEEETKVGQVTSNAGGGSEEMMLMAKNANGQRFVTDVSVTDIPEVQLAEDNGRKLDGDQFSRHDMPSAGDIADSSLVCKKDNHSMISEFPLDRTITSASKKKLLVLDVNGLLADFVEHVPYGYKPDTWISRKAVFKRPFCDDFLEFCFDKFYVGVWSSRHGNNVDAAIQFLMGKSASKLLFCWNQSHCTMTDFTTVENKDKPLVLKELRKLWEKLEAGLPWEKGEFNESNTLLLDDSPHKALVNPMNTAIFPYSYHYRDTRDSSLGPGGYLRTYLEGLAIAEDVQGYVASNPFGQRPIRESNPSWRYYRKVIDSVNSSYHYRTSSCWERRSY